VPYDLAAQFVSDAIDYSNKCINGYFQPKLAERGRSIKESFKNFLSNNTSVTYESVWRWLSQSATEQPSYRLDREQVFRDIYLHITGKDDHDISTLANTVIKADQTESLEAAVIEILGRGETLGLNQEYQKSLRSLIAANRNLLASISKAS
jgi:hypothetical protein